MEVHDIPLRHVAAFNGVVRGGLAIHEDASDHITLYKVAGTSILQRTYGQQQAPKFLQGHSDKVGAQQCTAGAPTHPSRCRASPAPLPVARWPAGRLHQWDCQQIYASGTLPMAQSHTICPSKRYQHMRRHDTFWLSQAHHQGRIQAISWSCDERFLVTLGGPDDNTLARRARLEIYNMFCFMHMFCFTRGTHR